MTEHRVGAASELTAGKIIGAGRYAVGNNGEYFAVTRRCRHMLADLANGTIDTDGCLVCPWHQSKYDVKTGRMVRGPRGVFARIPGLDTMFIALTKGDAASPWQSRTAWRGHLRVLIPPGQEVRLYRSPAIFLDNGGFFGQTARFDRINSICYKQIHIVSTTPSDLRPLKFRL